MDDDRTLYERIFFGMSHVIWVPALIAAGIWFFY
jgi:hypothetical protein